jgi:hypothetical protein
LIQKLIPRDYEPYHPDCLCIPSGRAANQSFTYITVDPQPKVMFNFDREKRYAIFFFENHDDIRALHEYLISYQVKHRRVMDMYRQRLVHPFGDVDHFALVYRHCGFFNEWLGIKTEPPLHRWLIPHRLVWSNFRVLHDTPDFQSFLRNLDETTSVGKAEVFDPEFAADLRELGDFKVVIDGQKDFYLESNRKDIDWMIKWTLLKLRWT